MYQNSDENNALVGEEETAVGGGALKVDSPNLQDMDQKKQDNINYNGKSKNVRKKPYVKILEQPAGKALRFRYECEGRSAGSIPGVNSTTESKTFPAIEIVGYKGRAVVVVSCVTKDQPYRPHPHNLVGKDGCKRGVCTIEINPDTMRAVFSNLGIQCVKKKDIEAALKAREEIRVDPFKTGFTHRFQPSSIDLNSVRLCFQVFMESEKKGCFTQPLPPVVSDPIYDKKAMSDLSICRLCSCSANVLGNTQIILLCEKVAKEDISVRFYEEKNGQTIWEAYGEFQHTDVHKQTAIAFKTPRYRKIDITEPAKVLVQLKRPSDGVASEALPFEYVPLDSDPGHLKRKRQKTDGDPVHFLIQQQNQHQNDGQDGRQANVNSWNAANLPAIKTEPRDTSPQPFGIHRVPPQLTPSPQPLSPPCSYTQSTPSPYNIAPAVTLGTQGNQRLISPNQQYNANSTVGGCNNRPLIDITEYNSFGQQTQPQQHQYHGSNMGAAGAAAPHWGSKCNTAIPAGGNLINLNNTNSFAMNNILTSSNPAETPGPNNAGWNLATNHFPPHQLHQQYQQHPTQGVSANNNGILSNAAVAAHNANNANMNEHGFSNLLTFDSEQYVRINTEDQQMLRLDTEDLQISNLSITT